MKEHQKLPQTSPFEKADLASLPDRNVERVSKVVERPSMSFELEPCEDENSSVSIPYSFHVSESIRNLKNSERGEQTQTPKNARGHLYSFQTNPSQETFDKHSRGGYFSSVLSAQTCSESKEEESKLSFQAKKPINLGKPPMNPAVKNSSRKKNPRLITISIQSKDGSFKVKKGKPSLILGPKPLKARHFSPEGNRTTICSSSKQQPNLKVIKRVSVSTKKDPVGHMITRNNIAMGNAIPESEEESMLHDYWATKEEVDQKYKLLFDKLKQEEDEELNLRIEKLVATNNKSATAFLDTLSSVKENYDKTRRLIQEQKLVEEEQILLEYQEILL